MTTGPATFGAQLRRHRLAAGLTQEELAERAGLSARGIQDLERGARRLPHPETVRRLTAALGQLDGEPRATLAPTPPRPSLPATLTSFVGRKRAITELGSLLRVRRLVTLTGPGGIGKTRLALEVTSRLAARHEERVWLADLSPLVDGQLVVHAVATALGVREQPFRTLVETVCEVIADRPAVLVLDNCEHLLDGAVALVDTLIRRCPELRVLCTSREPLRISGEVAWRVPPLSTDEATKLFLERAETAGGTLPATESGTQAIADICQRLEGVPLAIELAAVRTAMFSAEQIVPLLDDAFRLLHTGPRTAPARHRGLRATIRWSYDLLTAAERVLLERLSVFAGGWTLQAAEAVAQVRPGLGDAPAPDADADADPDALDGFDILDLLGRLVDRSLVIAERMLDGIVRYRLQEVLRQFSHEQLQARGETDAVQARHANYFMHVLRESERRGLSAERRAVLDRIEVDLDNLRAARRWFVARGNGKAAQRFESGLYRLLMYRGHASEGRQSLLTALALPGGSNNTRAKALQCLSALAFTQADYADSAEYGTAGLALHRQIDDPIGLTYAFLTLGMTASVRGEFTTGESLLCEGRQASRRTANKSLVALSLALSANMEYLRGRFDAARQYAHQAIEASQTTGFGSPTCMALVTLGNLSHHAGDAASASELLSAGLTQAEDLAETYLIIRAAISLALLSADQGDVHGARALLDESLGRAVHLGNRHHVAQVLEGVAAFAASQRRDGAALRFASAASVIRRSVGAPRSPTEEQLLDARLAPARHALGAAPAAAASAEATRWPIDQAVARARAFLNR
jgi:predicted ATPase/DNA-binding XRE family transcriptional regulator